MQHMVEEGSPRSAWGDDAEYLGPYAIPLDLSSPPSIGGFWAHDAISLIIYTFRTYIKRGLLSTKPRIVSVMCLPMYVCCAIRLA